jgi:glycosyltransferase involved in cell wall biosynthesis
MVAPPWYEVPPSGYGGLELICAALVDGLVARGHEVTLIGAGRRTGTSARFISTTTDLQYERLGEAMPGALHGARVNRLLAHDDYDIIHDHTLEGPLTAEQRQAPTIVTVHGPAVGELGDYYAELGESVHLVAISDSQRRQRPDLSWAATVHNGIVPDWFTASDRHDGPVLWLARFCQDKGPDIAIEACRKAGVPLVLAGKVNEPGEHRYLKEVIEPMLGDDVKLVLNADRPTTQRLLGEARSLIMPIRWHEPFGMVMIEAMACGTPVVALRRGSVPEVVNHGVTGFICDEPEQLPEALSRTSEIDSNACVAHVRNAFSANIMAYRYEQVYRRVIARAAAVRSAAADADATGVTPTDVESAVDTAVLARTTADIETAVRRRRA